MDWGRQAYVKAEELEGYLRKTNAGGGTRTAACATFYPRAAAEAGYVPCAAEGSGNMSVSVSLALSAPAGADEIKVWLLLGDSRAAYTTVTLPENGRGSVTMYACAYPDGALPVGVRADAQGLIIDEMRVLCEGTGAALSTARGGYRCDCLGNEIFLLHEKDGYLYLGKYGGEAETDVAHGSVFDLCCDDDSVAVLCSDDDDNLWGVKYAPDLKETSRTYLGSGKDSVAIGRTAFGYALAAVKDRKVYVARCESDFSGMTDWSRADFETEADEVYLCKQSQNPVLALRRDGKLYAKLPFAGTGSRDCVRVCVSLVV